MKGWYRNYFSVHYAYGNLDYAQKRWEAAKCSYEQSLRIGLASAPIHPITAAAYYSLGCVEHMRGNFDNASKPPFPFPLEIPGFRLLSIRLFYLLTDCH